MVTLSTTLCTHWVLKSEQNKLSLLSFFNAHQRIYSYWFIIIIVIIDRGRGGGERKNILVTPSQHTHGLQIGIEPASPTPWCMGRCLTTEPPSQHLILHNFHRLRILYGGQKTKKKNTLKQVQNLPAMCLVLDHRMHQFTDSKNREIKLPNSRMILVNIECLEIHIQDTCLYLFLKK